MNERIIAGAQIGLSVLYTVGYFAIVIMFMLGYAEVPDRFENMFTGLINLLSAAQLAVIYFWFQRTRPKTDDQQGVSNA
jgi:hypothetical protein